MPVGTVIFFKGWLLAVRRWLSHSSLHEPLILKSRSFGLRVAVRETGAGFTCQR